MRSTDAFLPRSVRVYNHTSSFAASYTPRNRSPSPMGNVRTAVSRLNSAEISSSTSQGDIAGRSSLFTKVNTGRFDRRATPKSFRVCGSRPLPPSTSMTALSAALSVRYVSSEKSAWPGVSIKLMRAPPYSKVKQVDDMEMPRSFSMARKSDVESRPFARALTMPACWIASPYNSSFSVSVVFPASGWLMMAKLRLLAISSGGAAAARSLVVVRGAGCGRNAAAAVARRSRECIAGSMRRSRWACSQDVRVGRGEQNQWKYWQI